MNETSPILLAERKGRRITITLNRPEKHNAMTLELWRMLHRTILEIRDDRSVSIIVLRGAGGRAFSAGMDIREEYQTFCTAVDEIGRAIHGCCRDLMQLPQVVLCVVEGYCFGAALELMLSCDYVLANDKAVFSLPEMKVGIPCMVESALLVPAVGLLKAKEMCYFGRSYDASQALQMGLVNEVVDGSVLEQRIEERIADLCQMDPPALAAQKDIIHKWLTSDLETAMQYSILAMKPCEGSEAQRNRMRQALGIKETEGG
jgi:enoyl-CoA hydratase